MLLLPLWLAAIARLVGGVCYVKTVETVARSVVFPFVANNLAHCEQNALTVTNAEAVVFNTTTRNCVMLNKPAPGSIGCEPGYTRYVKMQAGCAPYDVTEGYYASPTLDPCLTNAKFSPELLKTESSPICPNTPVDGEPRARTYVVAVILPRGAYAVLDNNSQAQIVWDGTNPANASWVYRYISGRNTYSTPIFAASCAYFPDGVATDTCPCASPLPMESSTAMEQGATAAEPSLYSACPTDYSGKFIQTKSLAIITCGPCGDSSIVCMAGIWIYNVTVPSGSVPGQINSYQLSSGTCYMTQPPP